MTCVLTMTLAIGATAATFAVVHAVLLNPLPFRTPGQLVRLVSHVPAEASPTQQPLTRNGIISVAELIALRRQAPTLSHVGVYVNTVRIMADTGGTTRLEGWRVEPAVFEMLGVSPALGRSINTTDAAIGAEPVVMLGYDTWRSSFGSDPAIVHRSIALDGVQHRIVGVMPRQFEFPYELGNRQFWIPLLLDTNSPSALNVRVPMVARVSDAASIDAARAEVGRVLGEVAPPGIRYELVPLREQLVAPITRPLIILLAAVALVLLIACANVANLLLSRTGARVRELAVRASLGANRSRLVRQLLTEGVVVAAMGAVGGIALATGAVRLIQLAATTLPRMDLGLFVAFPRVAELSFGGVHVGFAILVATAAGISAGVLPALRYGRPRPDALRADATSGRASRGVLHHGLIVAQVAMAVILLVGSGLLVRTLVNLLSVHPGYDATRVITFQIATPSGRYRGDQLREFAENVAAQFRSVPGVESSSYGVQLPMVAMIRNGAGFSRTPNTAAGGPPPEDEARFVSRDYLSTLGIRIVSGHGFAPEDGRTRPRTIVINQTLARRHFRDSDPVGEYAYLRGVATPWLIAGVAEDVRQSGLDKPPSEQVFVDITQWPSMPPGFHVLQYFAVRTAGSPAAAIASLRDALKHVDADASVYNVATMDQLVSNSISRPRLYAGLVGVFGVIAIVLAAVGVYGAIALSVAQRTRELGVRLALGAQARDMVHLVVKNSLLSTCAGVVVGLVFAAALTRYLRSMLFGVTALDASTFLGGVCLVVVVALVAAFLPARRAATVDPAITLRQ
jgi:putative ABC transport system permease protein